MRCDLHGRELADAIIEIFLSLKEAKNDGDTVIEIVHGYHHGNVIGAYVRSMKFISEASKQGYKLQRISTPHPGSTVFKIQ